MSSNKVGLICCITMLIVTILLSTNNIIQSMKLKEANERLCNLETVVLELENENYSLDEFQNQTYYNINLSQDLQEYTFIQCIKYDVDPVLALAVMKTESGFNADAVSETNDYGIMQINACNHQWLSDAFGDIDLINAKDNIRCGVYMLSKIKYPTREQKLMIYNMGSVHAKALWEKGTYSTDYTEKVIDNMKYIQKKEVIM